MDRAKLHPTRILDTLVQQRKTVANDIMAVVAECLFELRYQERAFGANKILAKGVAAAEEPSRSSLKALKGQRSPLPARVTPRAARPRIIACIRPGPHAPHHARLTPHRRG